MPDAAAINGLVGFGSPDADLSSGELREIVERSLSVVSANERVLAIVPDKTRDDITDRLFPFAAEVLSSKKVSKLDVLIAQGTHAAMTDGEKKRKLGVGDGQTIRGIGKIFDHQWNDPGELIEIGSLDRDQVAAITNGLFNESISIRINRLLAPSNYDRVLIFGSTAPHEVAGFSGGAKYFFPGISGRELTNATHWIGALAGIENTIGRVETPVRHLIESAAEFVSPMVICFSSVTTRTPENRLRTHALFAGDLRQSFRAAAEVSAKVHIKHTDRKYRRVVAILDEHYDELWTGGKASYKLGAIIEDGGELIIYAPHLKCFSRTHGRLIERYGYGEIGRIKQLITASDELRENLCVAAHLAHVAYAGRTDSNGSTVPRYNITLATQINEEACENAKLRFLDPHKFRIEDYRNDEDTLIVPSAGRDLYRVGQ